MDLTDGRAAPVQRGLSKGVTGRVRIAQFNDPDTLRAALGPRYVEAYRDLLAQLR